MIDLRIRLAVGELLVVDELVELASFDEVVGATSTELVRLSTPLEECTEAEATPVDIVLAVALESLTDEARRMTTERRGGCVPAATGDDCA